MQHLSIRLLGRPEVQLDGQPVRFPTRKALALLVYLAAADEAQSRETLMALLWPNSATSSAQASLRNALARLRTTLGDAGGIVITTPDAIGIEPAADFDLDLRVVSAAVAAIRDPSRLAPPALLQAAVDVYRDEFLSAFIIGDAPDFNHWALIERERWHRQLSLVLEHLAQFHLKHLALPAAIATASRWVQHDPLDEAACRTLMQAHALSGDRSAALAQYAARSWRLSSIWRLIWQRPYLQRLFVSLHRTRRIRHVPPRREPSYPKACLSSAVLTSTPVWWARTPARLPASYRLESSPAKRA